MPGTMTNKANLVAIGRRKAVLLVLLGTSAAVPLALLRYDEPTAALTTVKVLAKTGSLVGTVLLVWQMVLGFRVVSTLFHEDLLWLIRVHQHLGTGAIGLIALHPIFIPVYYAWKFDRPVYTLNLREPFYGFVWLGILAAALLAFIFITSVPLRRRLGYARWFATHLTTYFVLPLAFLHALPIGMTLRETPLKWAWGALAVVTAAVIAARVVNLAGWRTQAYEVTGARKLVADVTELSMRPLDGALKPRIGQFVYVRRRQAGSQRPYSVAGYDDDGRLTIAAKAGQDFSVELQHVQAGERLYLDGPYGVFSQEVLQTDRPVVMAAGGIGITAFTRLIEHLDQTADRPAWLFYGNPQADGIAYRDQLDAFDHVEVVHVISDQADYPGEKGFITIDLIEHYVGRPLAGCEFLICGPPIMTEKLEKQLLQADVPDEQIHHELFGF